MTIAEELRQEADDPTCRHPQSLRDFANHCELSGITEMRDALMLAIGVIAGLHDQLDALDDYKPSPPALEGDDV